MAHMEGSNPLAPTNSSKILRNSAEFSLAVHSVLRRQFICRTECSMLHMYSCYEIIRDFVQRQAETASARAAVGSNR